MLVALGVRVEVLSLVADGPDIERSHRIIPTCYRTDDFEGLSPRLRAIAAIAGDVGVALVRQRDLSDTCALYLEAISDPFAAEIIDADCDPVRMNLEVAPSPERYLVALTRATSRILRRHWQAIEECVELLMISDHISGEEIWRLVHGHRP